jgi:hypothetical protein
MTYLLMILSESRTSDLSFCAKSMDISNRAGKPAANSHPRSDLFEQCTRRSLWCRKLVDEYFEILTQLAMLQIRFLLF